VAANGDILFVSSQGYDSEHDLLVAPELARRMLNDEIGNDPAYRARVEALMAPVADDAAPGSKLAEALS
jgi:hypothetical protein